VLCASFIFLFLQSLQQDLVSSSHIPSLNKKQQSFTQQQQQQQQPLHYRNHEVRHRLLRSSRPRGRCSHASGQLRIRWRG